MQENTQDTFDEEQQEVLESIKLSKVILPICLGILVVIYLLWKQFDPVEFAKIQWTGHIFFWIGLSLVLLILRHLAYALRLRTISGKAFSWKKCIELIFIWEFSSAVSPTSVGGSAVALFVLSQEKLSTAKTATIVIYTIVLDTMFFLSTLPILYLFFGPSMIRPHVAGEKLDAWAYTFFVAYVMMFIYGSFFFYGLFKNPRQIKSLMMWFTNFKWLRRYKEKAAKLGDDIAIASVEIWKQKWTFHATAFLSTAAAWSCRFLLLNCLIIGFVNTTPVDFFTQSKLYARLETMFVIMAFSPTPGGAGFAEIVFNGFLNDYVPKGISLIIAFLWRLETYYAYLLAGVIIIPGWLANIIRKRKLKKEKKDNE